MCAYRGVSKQHLDQHVTRKHKEDKEGIESASRAGTRKRRGGAAQAEEEENMPTEKEDEDDGNNNFLEMKRRKVRVHVEHTCLWAPSCTYTTAYLETLKLHIQEAHCMQYHVQCATCGYKTDAIKELKEHKCATLTTE